VKKTGKVLIVFLSAILSLTVLCSCGYSKHKAENENILATTEIIPVADSAVCFLEGKEYTFPQEKISVVRDAALTVFSELTLYDYPKRYLKQNEIVDLKKNQVSIELRYNQRRQLDAEVSGYDALNDKDMTYKFENYVYDALFLSVGGDNKLYFIRRLNGKYEGFLLHFEVSGTSVKELKENIVTLASPKNLN